MTVREPTGLVVVVGMSSEARIVEAEGVRAVVSGGLTSQLAEQLEELPAGVASGIVSFGVCGGLNPSLKAGDLIIESNSAAWLGRLTSALPNARSGSVAGGDTMIASTSEKQALRERLGADAIDMETHLVKAFAERTGTPYAVVRAVSDPAESALPRCALVGLKPNGETDALAVVRSLAQRPWELPALLRTAREAGAALRALRDARNLLGPGLGCPDFVEHLVDVR